MILKTTVIAVFLLCLVSCTSQHHEESPLLYSAGSSNTTMECEAYRYIDQGKGSVNLENSWVSEGVMSEKKLSADKSDLGNLCISGETWLRDTIVRGESHIGHGARVIETEIYGPFEVQGDLTACEATFYDTVHVTNGMVSANQSCFQENLCAKSEIIILDTTYTQSIYIEPIGPRYNPQIVCIRKGSVVEGDIYFAAGCGKVFIDSTSTFCGTIYGGHIIKPFEYHEKCR